jgi:putative hemolysin
MGNSTLLHLFVILLLIMINGLFAMSEIAIVSVRKPRLQQRAEKGDKKAARALALAEDPEDFLSTVQIGITLIGILAGVFGGATLAGNLANLLEGAGFPVRYSGAVSVAVVVSIITYLSLVVGELVPKNLALQNAERVATAVAPFMYRLSRLVYPLVRLLSVSTKFLMQLLGAKPSTDPSVSDEEIAIMMEQGAEVGVFEREESEMVKRIFRLSDRQVSSLMTPRREIVWLGRADTADKVRHKVSGKDFSRFPVADGDLDHVVGYVEVKDLLKQSLQETGFDPFAVLHPRCTCRKACLSWICWLDLRKPIPTWPWSLMNMAAWKVW